jgi:hypothetical protein
VTNGSRALNTAEFARFRIIGIVMGLGAALLAAFVVRQALLFSESYWTGTIQRTYTEPLYGYLKSPAGLPRQADQKFGADYMCLYFAATNYLSTGTMYDSNSDPWHRPAVTFPPQMIYLVAHSIQGLSFPASVLLNSFLQIGFFLIAALMFVRNTSSGVIAAGLVFAGCMLFCTPIGTTWFERSQTDLYVGVAFVFFLKAIRDDQPWDFVLAGVFGSLKWSSLPFLASSALVYIFFSKKPLPHKIGFAGTTLALAFLFPMVMGRHSADYLRLVAESELDSRPLGMSLADFMPVPLAKIAVFVLPVLTICLYRFWKRTSWAVQSTIEVTFWTANAYICAGYGTVALEYRLVSALFLVPLLVGGRSILFPEAREPLSLFSRVWGIVIVLAIFRTQTHVPIVDFMFTRGRSIVPLIASNLFLLAVSLWGATRRTHSLEGIAV